MIDRERQKLVRKRQLRRVLKVHERQWAALETLRAEAAPVGSLALDDVPFPPDDTNPLCLRPGFSEARPRGPAFYPIPVIGSIACGDQRLSCSMRGSIEPCIEQFSR